MIPWVLSVPIMPSETLSSWLTRAALTQGCDPLVLTGSIWPEWRVWAVDIDRGLDDRKIPPLSAASGIPASSFKLASLRIEAEAVAGRRLQRLGTWPWILGLGSRNRQRRGGLQYCPACLQEDSKPYFRRHWRFAWQYACREHQTPLMSHCNQCLAPVQPHRLNAGAGTLAVCPICRFDLRNAPHYRLNTSTNLFQATAELVAGSSHGGSYFGQSLTSSEWFAVARFFTSLVRLALRQPESRLATALRSLQILHDHHDNTPLLALPLELLLPIERDFLFERTYRLMLIAQDDLLQTFLCAGVTANCLRSVHGSIPPPLLELVLRLPLKSRQPRSPNKAVPTPRSRRSVLMTWVRLQRKLGG